MKANSRKALSAIVFILLAGPVFAGGKISLRLHSGWAYILASDMNHGTQAFFNMYQSAWPYERRGGYRAVHSGYEFGGDIVLEMTPRLGVCIGVGHLQTSGFSESLLYSVEFAGPSMAIWATTRLSAVPVKASTILIVPLSRKFNLHTEVGLSYFFRARYSAEWWFTNSSFEEIIQYAHVATSSEKRTMPMGFLGSVSLEYRLLSNIYLYLDAMGRYAEFRGWKGTSVLERNGETPMSEQGVLYYEVVPALHWRLIMVQSSAPDGPGGKPRQAALDFSGFSLQFGIRIRL